MSDEMRIVKVGEIEFYIKDPDRAARERSDSEGARAYNKGIQEGLMFEAQMINVIKERGIWSVEKETEVAELNNELDLMLGSLEEGGIKLEDARKNAIRAFQIRNQLQSILSERISYLTETIEAKKRRAEFNCLVSECAVYNDDRSRKYFKDYADFLNQKDTVEAALIAEAASRVLYGLPDLDDTPEKQFLKEWNFVDDQLRLINEDGHLIDVAGRLIDENGNYIKYVGKNKRVVIVDSEGEEIKPFEKKPFLDKNGKPIEKSSG